MSPASGSAKTKRKTVDHLLEGTFDDEIVISDDDDESTEVPQPQTKEGTILSTVNRRASTRKPLLPANKPHDPRACSEEIRLLGGWESTPEDAVIIDSPSRTQRMPFKQARTPFSGGLRPMNTLSVQRETRSSKNDFILEKTRGEEEKPIRHTALRGMTPIKGQPALGTNHDIDNRPKKKARIGASPKDSQPSSSVTVTPGSPIESMNEAPSDLQNKYGYELSAAEISSSHRAGIRETPLRRIGTQTPDASRHHRPSQRSASPDPLLGTAEEFMKNARAQRLQSDENDELSMHRQSSDIVTMQKHPNSAPDQSEVNGLPRRSKMTLLKTPPRSKMDERLRGNDDSPDVLHAEFHTVRRTSNSKISPLSPTDHSAPPSRSFDLRTFVATGFLAVKDCKLEISDTRSTFAIRYNPENQDRDALSPSVPVAKIVSLMYPETEDNNIVLARLSGSVYPENCCYFEFTSPKTYFDFCQFLNYPGLGFKTLRKSCGTLQGALSRAWTKTRSMLREQDSDIQHVDRQDDIGSLLITPESKPLQKRMRKVDQLDMPPAKSAGKHLQGMAPNIEHGGLRAHLNDTTVSSDSVNSIRHTRSRGHPSHREKSVTPPSISRAPPRRQGIPWKKPLIYPPTGKGKETVTWDDLDRLEDDQYLNDALVSLFLKYLQKHSNQERLKTIHYFSTFFYETLTRSSETKGSKRQINYQGVSNWTRNNNIFQRDYVVVPVNENYHWYVMIICNLRSFWNKHQGIHDEENMEEQPLEEIPDEPTKQILESDLVFTTDNSKEQLSDKEEDDKSTSGKTTAGRKRSYKGPGQRKFDVKKPVIITLDSLNMGRSNTAGVLKDYIIEEARTKHSITINKEDIPNMTAKAIPLQSNFTDCGLYVCMYLEQFMNDPEAFRQSVLQREPELVKWPRQIESGILRQRLYDILQELHDVQSGKQKETELPELGSILMRDGDFGRREGNSKPTALGMANEDINHRLDWLDQHNKGRDKEANTSNSALTEYMADMIDVMEDDDIPEVNETNQANIAAAHEPVTIEDESQEIVEITEPQSSMHSESPHHKRAQITSRHFPVSVEDEERLPLQPLLLDHHESPRHVLDSPAKLAKRLAVQRSPQRDMVISNTAVTTENQENEAAVRPQRSLSQFSVTTEYLEGDESYINVDHQQGIEETEKNDPNESEWNGFDNDVQFLGHKPRSGHDGNTNGEEMVIAESDYGDGEDESDRLVTSQEHTDMLMTD